MKLTDNTLIIGDRHAPFTHPDYLDFCIDTFKQYGCKNVADVGDSVDHHAISFHDKDPGGYSASEEVKAARANLAPWFKAFPRGRSCIGNHDALIRRKAMAYGLPEEFLKSFGDIYGAPAGWSYDFEWNYGNWRLLHGTGSSGHDAAFKAAVSGRVSTAQGHIHTAASVKFHASSKDILWGMQVACGIDRKAYAFAYGRDFKDKPILGCGVVTEGGTLPFFVPMKL